MVMCWIQLEKNRRCHVKIGGVDMPQVHPEFAKAVYTEAILAPGQDLSLSQRPERGLALKRNRSTHTGCLQ
eukprot:64387-Amphidinium_carterae.1